MQHLGGRTHLYLHIKDPHDVQGMAFVSNPVFEKKSLDAMLVPINVRKGDLEDVLPRLAKLGNVKGFLISMPFKESVLTALPALGPQARLTGSANCVRIEAGGRLTGEMFDGQGLLRAAAANGIASAGKRMLLLGAGGAARAIAFAAVHEGVASIEVFNRTHSRAERLVADLKVAFPHCVAKTADGAQSDAEFVVSCIPGLRFWSSASGGPAMAARLIWHHRYRPGRRHRALEACAGQGGQSGRRPANDLAPDRFVSGVHRHSPEVEVRRLTL